MTAEEARLLSQEATAARKSPPSPRGWALLQGTRAYGFAFLVGAHSRSSSEEP